MPAPDAASRQDRIAQALADYLLEHGLAAATLRPLAAAAGLSDRMLLYHFPDKAAAVAAGLEVVAGRVDYMLQRLLGSRQPLPFATAERLLRHMVLDPAIFPYMRLWLELAHAAARGDPALRPVAQRIGEGFLARAEALLEGEGEAQRRDAVRLLALTEGAVLLQAIGLDAALSRLD